MIARSAPSRWSGDRESTRRWCRRASLRSPAPLGDVPVTSCRGSVLGPGRLILLPEGVGIDLGGIAKGWTIQQAAHRLGMWGPCLVDAGGDIACVGTPPGEPWVVTVADPRRRTSADEDIAVLSLSNAAIATSSRVYRSWRHAGRPAHHLIDPRTGAPAATNILSVTVTGRPPARRRDLRQDGADPGRRAGAGLSQPTVRRGCAGRDRRRPPPDDRQL